MMRSRVLAAAALVTACATTTTSVPVHYSFADAPERGGIELAWRNNGRRAMCLSQWPNAAGKLHVAGDSVFLVVEGRHFAVEDFNTGYCIPSCSTRVRPGKQVTAFIRYEDFSLPADLAEKPKTLIFSPVAHACAAE